MTGDSSLGGSLSDGSPVFCCSGYARFSGPSSVSLAVTVSLIDGIFVNGLKGARLLGVFSPNFVGRNDDRSSYIQEIQGA